MGSEMCIRDRISPDEKTIEYLKGRPFSPAENEYQSASDYWLSLASDEGAAYDKTVNIDASDIIPQVTWGTSPEDVVSIDGLVPNPEDESDETKKKSMIRALIIDFFFVSSLSSSGFGTNPSIETTSSGLVPQVTCGMMSLASIFTVLS